MYFIYILYSPSADKYYIGHTNDIIRRMEEHNHSLGNKYSSKYRPWILKVSFQVGNQRGLARKIENHIKRQKSRVYIEGIIQLGNIDVLIEKFSKG